MKTGGKRRGFLCQSHASTAVCIPGDSRSVIVPCRPDRTIATTDHSKLMDLKYSRLIEPRHLSSSAPRLSYVAERKVHNAPRTVRRERTVAKARAASSTDANVGVDITTTTAHQPPVTTTYSDVFQVVVMRVAIHCQGCACKVKKHISKMEGVTSFSIDLETKRVTVMGHISPLGVLESISKVKKAEFWQG